MDEVVPCDEPLRILRCVQVLINDGKPTSPTTTPSIRERFLQLRKLKTVIDADLVIKMSGDFIKDMQHKMTMVKRTARNYETSSDYAVASVYDDIQRRFKHMCDLYKQFATVNRYVYGKDINEAAESPDVVLVYQIMLSDYNEILMILELLKMEQKAWQTGSEEDVLRELIRKQMEKFGNLPDSVTPPKLTNDGNTGTGGPPGRRRWAPNTTTSSNYQQKWTGELDGVSFDSR